MDFENKWEPEDSDDEYEEEEYIQNEVLPPDVDQEFRNNVLNVKHILYDNTILKPELGTPQVQSNRLLDEYLKNINQMYVLSLNAQKGLVNESELNQFPEKARQPIKQVLEWLADYFKKNRVPDTIPYGYYITQSFKEYPFVQDNSFE
jgi:hypothetical protein